MRSTRCYWYLNINLGCPSSLPILLKHLNPEFESAVEVRETCELAIAKIHYDLERENNPTGGYESIDPAPPLSEQTSTFELGELLMNESLPLFNRYRAMFSLRNIGTEESVLQLAKGFESSSALFRHEIAYVFGQMQHLASVPSLIKTLKNINEVDMVRHECAEALGSIGTSECFEVLDLFKGDQDVVQESCTVGLDILDWENSNTLED